MAAISADKQKAYYDLEVFSHPMGTDIGAAPVRFSPYC